MGEVDIETGGYGFPEGSAEAERAAASEPGKVASQSSAVTSCPTGGSYEVAGGDVGPAWWALSEREQPQLQAGSQGILECECGGAAGPAERQWPGQERAVSRRRSGLASLPGSLT